MVAKKSKQVESNRLIGEQTCDFLSVLRPWPLCVVARIFFDGLRERVTGARQ
jgi:hypothetical protein